MTSRHLVAHGNLSLLSYINTNRLIHTGRKLVAVLPGENLGIHHNTIFAVRYFQRSVPNFPCLFTENSTKKPFLRSQLRLALGRNLAHQNIAGPHLCADTYNSPVVQILQRIVAHTGNIPGNLLRP